MADKESQDLVNMEYARLSAYCEEVGNSGILPSKGFYGEPLTGQRAERADETLAGGWRFRSAGWKADAKARTQIHKLRHNAQANTVCHLDEACKNNGGAHFGDFRDGAEWQATAMSHTDYMNSHSPRTCSPWALFYTHWCLTRLLFDMMHDFNLGWGKDICASVIAELLENGSFRVFGATPDLQLKGLSLWLRKWCKKHRISIPPRNFTQASIGRDSARAYPCLDSGFKAAHVKIILFFLVHVTQKFCDGSYYSRTRTTCIWACANWLYVLDRAGLWLTDEEQANAYRYGRLFLLSYQYLASANLLQGVCNYKIRPKSHSIQHVIDRHLSSKENPRFHNCFMDEDFMGKIARLCRHCHGGDTMTTRAMQRYLLHMAHRWWRGRVQEGGTCSNPVRRA